MLNTTYTNVKSEIGRYKYCRIRYRTVMDSKWSKSAKYGKSFINRNITSEMQKIDSLLFATGEAVAKVACVHWKTKLWG